MIPLSTCQTKCYDTEGNYIPCMNTGQDGEYQKGLSLIGTRFKVREEIVKDNLTHLYWSRNANLGEFPMTWIEAFQYIRDINRNRLYGHNDWRLPNRQELRSLITYQYNRPSLPLGHPFLDVFSNWYWTSTTASISPKHAWYVHMEGARIFYGGKDQSYMVWPVRGTSNVLNATGQRLCYDQLGAFTSCDKCSQDGTLQNGQALLENRFKKNGNEIKDHLTALIWFHNADIKGDCVSWKAALDAIAQFNKTSKSSSFWRLPNINELDSLVDCANFQPALTDSAPFNKVQSGYWSSTTSTFEPDWAWALYLDKGALGVGQKKDRHFHIWPVRSG